ncbi:replication factor A protein 1-like [Rutidosis leptorrhynchoides]|uniref:replication factor A protein 1-like n=1 Tax=Rutidosis leptorrhynchoides TaxID=125765 RepID=UPI003A99877D
MPVLRWTGNPNAGFALDRQPQCRFCVGPATVMPVLRWTGNRNAGFVLDRSFYCRMASKYSQIDDVCPGRIDWKIKARVLNLWTIPNFCNRIGDGSIEMILLDDKHGRIQATIKKDLLATYRQQISEGEVYSFQKIFVSKPTNKLKATRNQYKLFFLKDTIVEKISNEGISKFTFNFVSFDSILNKENESFMFDVIGHVVENEKVREIVKPNKTMKLLTFVLEDLEKKRINCTLWDAFVEKLNEALLDATTLKKSIVVILQSAVTNTFNKISGISNNFQGTKIFVNPNLPEDVEYSQKLNDIGFYTQIITQLSGPVSMSDEFLLTKRITVKEVSISLEVGHFTMLARVIEVESTENWYYEGCTMCNKKVEKNGTKWWCPKCQDMVIAEPKFKMQVRVHDRTETTSLILFDRMVKLLIGKSATNLINPSKKEKTKKNLLAEFEAIADKELLFKFGIIEEDLFSDWDVTYTVKRVTSDEGLIKQFKDKHFTRKEEEEEDVDADLEDTDREDSNMTPTTDKSNKRKGAMYISSDDEDDIGKKSSKVRPRLIKVKVEKEDELR